MVLLQWVQSQLIVNSNDIEKFLVQFQEWTIDLFVYWLRFGEA